MSITRNEIRELCAEHDRMMMEHADWMARREAAGAAPVQKSDEPAVLYREHHDNAPEPAPQRDAEASDDDLLPYAIDEFTKAVVEKFSAVDRENQYLRGKLDALLTLLGKSDNLSNLKAADVVELPHGFLRRRTDHAA